MTGKNRRSLLRVVFIGPLLGLALAACSTGGFSALRGDRPPESVYAPGVNQRAEAVDGIEVGHRLIAAGQYELAIKSFNRAALDHGLTGEILSALGSANLGLGRLGQAETLLRRAVEKDAAEPEVWNNLGVVLMESGQTAEAEQIFRKAYALDNGESDAIRDNLRLALAKTEKSVITEVNEDNYKLVRRGSGDYLIRPTP
ncbi:tetratricopeptide repeat protein [Sulfitobacter sp. W027]|jgi:Flp pilus assembly protein TadD|uniref:tetratricopeptide repeat protein n=1 Tax=Sulfitobacter sp. W027 TaxID=2867025 RepID=UPI0021A7AB37|nr:tetratricopeptide repeat protein [Sulfitobacter sp. W027]UWR34292.1 tetratricopeptide repeat protein [Sulfitobacter sp. W027]